MNYLNGPITRMHNARLHSPANLRTVDVQLLLAFESLMVERHVTKAARQLGLSQSALSHALARLRDSFNDPLLIHTSRGMEPTPRALELIDPVRDALRHLEAIFDRKSHFVPAETECSFVMRIGDAHESLLLPKILTELESKAPKVSLVVQHLSATDTVSALESSRIDIAISAFLVHPKTIRSSRLLTDRMVCAMSQAHAASGHRARLTTKQFLALRHIRVVQHQGDVRFVDEELRRRGLSRTVVATIPYWMAALHAVASSNTALVVPELTARRFDVDDQLILRRLPFGGEPFSWQLYWHHRHDADPAQRWIRGLLADVCKDLFQQNQLVSPSKPQKKR